MPDQSTETTKQPTKAERQVSAAAKAVATESKGIQMKVKVYAPFKVYFDGDAQSISAVNDTGPFDILPKHHNFITLLNEGEVVVRTAEKEEAIHINRGIMHVKADQVVVFLDV